jgi:hypothetical protein
VTTYSYDDSPGAGGRLYQTKLYSSVAAYDNGAGSPDETITTSYDGLGRVSSLASDVNGTVSYSYDAEGRTTQVKTLVGARTDQVNYEYNAIGELVRTYTGDTDVSHSSANSDGKAMAQHFACPSLGDFLAQLLPHLCDAWHLCEGLIRFPGGPGLP